MYPFQIEPEYCTKVNDKWEMLHIGKYCRLGDTFPLHDQHEAEFLAKKWASLWPKLTLSQSFSRCGQTSSC